MAGHIFWLDLLGHKDNTEYVKWGKIVKQKNSRPIQSEELPALPAPGNTHSALLVAILPLPHKAAVPQPLLVDSPCSVSQQL